MNVWVRFALVQLVMFVFWALGIVVLIAPCALQAWETSPEASIKDGRKIDRWRWPILRWLGYHNPEDGDSGQMALVHGDQPYMPGADPRWRAYCWSAWRNSADDWKYRLAWEEGHLYRFRLFGLVLKCGWQLENKSNVPIFNISK